ncbi:unnamed protein product [Colias eurytheme]|nr:unnamed protein product [Colias eurytheme]
MSSISSFTYDSLLYLHPKFSLRPFARPTYLSSSKILQFVHRHLQCAYLNVNKGIKKRPPEAFPLNRSGSAFHQWAKRTQHIHNDITADGAAASS